MVNNWEMVIEITNKKPIVESIEQQRKKGKQNKGDKYCTNNTRYKQGTIMKWKGWYESIKVMCVCM